MPRWRDRGSWLAVKSAAVETAGEPLDFFAIEVELAAVAKRR